MKTNTRILVRKLFLKENNKLCNSSIIKLILRISEITIIFQVYIYFFVNLTLSFFPKNHQSLIKNWMNISLLWVLSEEYLPISTVQFLRCFISNLKKLSTLHPKSLLAGNVTLRRFDAKCSERVSGESCLVFTT